VLYPTGSKQLERTPKFVQYFKQADVIAGDYLYIDKYMPEDLQGKIILTNTTTSENVEELKKRGVSLLITTTPVIEEEVLEPMFWRAFSLLCWANLAPSSLSRIRETDSPT